MGLFDDLLKKPSNTTAQGSSGGSGTSSGGNDPLAEESTSPLKIEKSAETFLQTEEMDTTPNTPEPPKVTAVAEDDASSIIIGSPAQEETPQEETTIAFLEESTPASNSSETFPSVESSDSLLSVLDEASNQTTTEEAVTEKPAITTEEMPVVSESILSLDDTTAPESHDEVLHLVSDEVPKNSDSPFHPEEFIEESLTKITSMIATIDAHHEAKLAEADGYKKEKERFAELEQKAYDEADTMITERNHAERMRNYFMSEKVQQQPANDSLMPSEPKTSVETTLTGLAVQNAVTSTVQAPTKPAESTQTVPEESIIALAS